MRKGLRTAVAMATAGMLVLMAGCGAGPRVVENPVAGEPAGVPAGELTAGQLAAGLPAGVIRAMVIGVVDGDTVDVEINGRQERVRLIGVDTPEVHGQKEPYGPEASAFTKATLAPGTPVYLELDAQERDRYGRLLAYVWQEGGSLFNEALLIQGYAQLLTIPPNVRYVQRLQAAQERARAEGRGLWAETAPSQDAPPVRSGAEDGAFPPDAEGNCVLDGQEQIKGNIRRDGERIYHRPGGASYAQTKAEACFRSEAAAEAAGYRPAQR